MVTLPAQFIATKYPGYYWNEDTETLFSCKQSGVLREMVYIRPTYFNNYFSGYRISVNGQKRHLWLDKLRKLKPVDSIFPTETK